VQGASTVNEVHVVVPAGIDDPATPSGGNVYDGRICQHLAASGWDVQEHAAAGSWPRPDATAEQALARTLAGIPAGAVVLIDGLIASAVPAVLVPAARRIRLVVLVHMLAGDERPGNDVAGAEYAVLSAAGAIIATSSWTHGRLLDLYRLPADRVAVAEPGVDGARVAPGTAGGGELLCVAAIQAHKGHEELLAALASIADLSWRCVCVGSVSLDPAFVALLRRRARIDGIADRVVLAGPRTGRELDRTYATSDALVLASRAETYGMVVTEALARGLPVIATAVGGLPEALGHAPDGSRPGVLVPPGDVRALTGALRGWLDDAALRQRLRLSAAERRPILAGWSATADRIARVLTAAAAR
jgi:glycosyltransferase involved in cell wall biosynthesis